MSANTLFVLSGLLIILSYLPLFFLIVSKSKSKLPLIYSLHILSIMHWGISSFLIGICTNQLSALIIWKFAYIGVLFIPVFFQHTVLLLLKKKCHPYLFFIYIQAFFFVVHILRNDMVTSTRLLFSIFYYSDTSFRYLLSFSIWISIASIAHMQLLHHYKLSYPQEKKQIFALFLAITGFLGGMTNFLPVFGLNIYPLGNFLIPIHSFIVSHAIFKHQLLDIKIAIRKSIVYSILIGFIFIFYLILIIILEKSLQILLGYQSLTFSIITAFSLGILSLPLITKIQQFIDKLLFKGTPEEIALQNEQLKEEIAKTEKYKTLATLASGIAHEIRNPLTSINTFAEYLPRKINDAEFLEKFSKIVSIEVTRINQLVHQLLDYSKPSPPSFKKADIHRLISETLDLLSNKCLQQKITVHKAFDPNMCLELTLDPQQIRQALLNILLNAIEAMPAGGKLTVATRQSADKLLINVRDTGCGISSEDLTQVFDPFFSKKDTGTGLGLSITQSLIEKHNGKVKIKSAVNIGTEVTIELPQL